MASGDAKAIPIKNVALRITLPLFDADGDLVSGATGLDSEISKDGGAFADCTNEATEIGSSGIYTLDLTATEMNADTAAVIVKTTSAGAKTTPIVLYTAARSINDLAFPTTTGRSMDVDASGGVEVGSFQAGAITNAAFAAGAIDAAAIAANAIGASEIADGAITAAKIADGAIDAATFAAGAINAAAIATDAITAAKIAPDAIGASELATDAINEIADQVWDEALAGHLGAGSAGESLAFIPGTVVAIQADTDNIQTRLPAALVGGRMDASVGAMAADVLTAAAIATDAIGSDELAASAVTEIQSGLATAAALATTDARLDTEIPAILAAVDTEVAAIKAVTDALPNAGALTTIQADLDDLQTRLPAALTAGGNIKADALLIEGTDPSDLINAAADTALADYDGPTHAELTAEINDVQADIAALVIPSVGAIADGVWDETLADHLGAGSTGEALDNADAIGTPPTAAAIADAVWDEALAGHVAAGSAGEAQNLLDDIDGDTGAINTLTAATLDAAISTRAAPGAAMDLVADAVDAAAVKADAVTEIQAGLATAAALATVQADTDDIQTRIPAALVAGRIDASVGAVATGAITAGAIAADAIGASELAADAVSEIQAGLATAAALALVAAEVTAIEGQTDDIGAAGAGLTAVPWNPAWDAEVQSEAADALNAYDPPTRTEATADKDEILAAIPAAADNADAVWDALAGDHVGAGSFGLFLDVPVSSVSGGSLTLADIADAVWDEAIAGHLAAGSTGEALANAGAAGTPPTADEIAIAVLSKPLADVEDTAPFRSLSGAGAKLTNRVRTNGATLTVYEADDVTALATQTLTRDASAEPVVEVNTN